MPCIMNTNSAISTVAAAKLTGISPRLAFYLMSQAPGDEGKSTKDFEKDSAPSCLNSQEEGGRVGWGGEGRGREA